MIESQSIHVFAPEISKFKDPAAGHFSAVRLDDFTKESLAATTVYSRKDFYKISLVTGNATYYYQGKEYTVNTGEWLLIFTNRDVPYRWHVEEACCGYACMFTDDFMPLHTYIRPTDWTVFNTTTQSVFKLDKKNKDFFSNLFEDMLAEQASNYRHKYELLFLYMQECIHGALKLNPEPEYQSQTAAKRLTESFKTLLAGQFPLLNPSQQLQMRVPQVFAENLAVHINYLNRAVKEVTGKTTTQLINERIMQEAYALIIHSNWSIRQIGVSLGFDEPTHFARAFKKYTGHTPSSLRNGLITV